ncbi:MAG: hypothetical protein E6Q88_01400 [Lysobacteraceae bacterium]|nr:MAG: hypothetical protein E6Q88_01400 [Xanthomonadaceae bacterium]
MSSTTLGFQSGPISVRACSSPRHASPIRRIGFRIVAPTIATRTFLGYPVAMDMARTTSPSASGRIVAPLMLAVLGIFGMSALWTIVGLIFDQQCAWMAAMTAADIALMLRLARMPPGWSRAVVCVLATVATIVVANWCIAAAQMGGAIGFGLVDSIQRLGSDHAQTLIGLANRISDLGWYAIALLFALWLGR